MAFCGLPIGTLARPSQNRLVNSRSHPVRCRRQPRAVMASSAEADWIVVDVAVQGLVDGVEPLAIEIERDGRALVKHALHDQPAELSLLLCSDAHILKLNTTWRGKEMPTDVLSFPQDDEVILGDIVISLDTARRQAAARGMEAEDELRVLMVHGLLHLMGYDHEKSEEELQMMADAEQRLMSAMGWRGGGLISFAKQMSTEGGIHTMQPL